MLKCDTCGLVKSESEFTINYRSKIDPNKVSYKKTCKSCRAKKQNVWSHNEGKESILNYRINNKEQHNEIQRRKDLDDEYVNSSTFLWMKLRSERDNLLLSSDFTQLGDIGLSESKKTEWINYRQALRDLPANTSDPANPNWPTKPS